MNNLLSNDLLIKETFKFFLLFEQWYETGSFERALHYKTKIQTIVELLEIEHCGSIGGFDEGQKNRDLASRFEWIAKKRWGYFERPDIVNETDLKKAKRGMKIIKQKSIS